MTSYRSSQPSGKFWPASAWLTVSLVEGARELLRLNFSSAGGGGFSAGGGGVSLASLSSSLVSVVLHSEGFSGSSAEVVVLLVVGPGFSELGFEASTGCSGGGAAMEVEGAGANQRCPSFNFSLKMSIISIIENDSMHVQVALDHQLQK